MKSGRLLLPSILSIALLLSSCEPALTPTSATGTPTINMEASQSPTSVSAQISTSFPETRLPPERWQEWPIVPTISPSMVTVYQRGLVLGKDTSRFSKIGDCQNVGSYFLSTFDKPGDYSLGEQYAYLQATIDQFAGSWSRESLAVKGGFNVAAVLSPLRSDKSICATSESPLDCELRVHNPSIVVISMETWWGNKPAETYEKYLRTIVALVLDSGAVPILTTKADNLEGDHSINLAVARVAYEYEVPLWNFWLAVQSLPDKGLSPDGFHLTYSRNIFDDPTRMKSSWPWRNLTALQAIDSVWRGLREAATSTSGNETPLAITSPTPLTGSELVLWQSKPVIPIVQDGMLDVYQHGLDLGNDPHAFSKIGDGEVSTFWFLSDFDFNPQYYNLGPYTDLQAVLDHFSGSFKRQSMAAGRGFRTTWILDPAYANESCQADESPLDCELRLHRPTYAFISLGTNQVWTPDVFEAELRVIIERLLDRGVIPILATKADNLEGDHSINAIIARLADEYGVPLWNFWQAVQPLQNHGLQADNEHLTYAGNYFDDAQIMTSAWPWRNLTALQTLDAVWKAVSRP